MSQKDITTLTLQVAFAIGDSVISKNKIGKDEGIVTGYSIRPGNIVSYAITWSDKKEVYHFDFELQHK